MQKRFKSAMVIAIIAIAAIAISLGCRYWQQPKISEEARAEISDIQELYFSQIGPAINKNPAYMKKSLATYEGIINKYGLNKEDDIVIAEVNGWPVTLNEIAYRAEMREAFAKEDSKQKFDYESVFNVLLEEKVNLSEAQKMGLLPTNEEFVKHFDQYREELESAQDFKALNNMVLEKTGTTEEDSWQIVAIYNEYRFMVRENLWKTIRQDWLDNGVSSPNSETDFYNSRMLEYKKEAYVKMLTDIPELQFKPALDKLIED